MKWILGLIFSVALVSVGYCQDSPYRKELKRADLSGTNMVVITSINEIPPGQSSMLHIHHGEEAFYVIDGGTIELPDGKQVPFPTGVTNVNVRDVSHGAFKVVGENTNKYYSLNMLEKDKLLYDGPKQ